MLKDFERVKLPPNTFNVLEYFARKYCLENQEISGLWERIKDGQENHGPITQKEIASLIPFVRKDYDRLINGKAITFGYCKISEVKYLLEILNFYHLMAVSF
ncbi:MAG: hypothetical protein PHF44_02415 [Candidatus Pacebacteria bacterium]|nr:hypothetical protein [Candidatus Paceibacterota bacterium]